jgi:hypothetical protein
MIMLVFALPFVVSLMLLAAVVAYHAIVLAVLIARLAAVLIAMAADASRPNARISAFALASIRSFLSRRRLNQDSMAYPIVLTVHWRIFPPHAQPLRAVQGGGGGPACRTLDIERSDWSCRHNGSGSRRCLERCGSWDGCRRGSYSERLRQRNVLGGHDRRTRGLLAHRRL